MDRVRSDQRVQRGKKTADAGRVFAVETCGITEAVVTGLAWRNQVCQQVFEEAAVDLGKGLKSWSESRSGKRKGKRVGFPRFKKKAVGVASFGCATNIPRASQRRSVSAITAGPARSRCPASVQSLCMMTAAVCGACSPRVGPKSVSPPSAVTAGGGGYR